MSKFILTALFILVSPLASLAVDVEVTPETLYPGDVFMVKVAGAELEPAGVHAGGWLNFARCGKGCFIALGAVELEAEPGPYRLYLSAEGAEQNVLLRVAPKEFPVLELTLPPDKVTLSPEDEKRAEREAMMLKELWNRETDRLWEGAFVLPLENGLSTVFGVKRIMNRVKTSVHTGVDMRGRQGEPVKAANRGRVVLAEELFFGGNTIVLDHGQGIYTVYMHLSKFRAKLGEVVGKGEVIGDVGATGRATGPHLHFGVKIGPASANPLSVTKLPL